MSVETLYFIDFGLEHISILACCLENDRVVSYPFFFKKRVSIPLQRPNRVFDRTENFETLIQMINEAEKQTNSNINEIILITKDQSIKLFFTSCIATFKKTQKVSKMLIEKLSVKSINEFYEKTNENSNILDFIQNSFIVDDEKIIKNPYKVPCKKIITNVSIVSIDNVFSKYFGAYLERFKIHVKHYISPTISTFITIKDNLINNGNFLFIDFGSFSTEICVIKNGCIVFNNKIDLGGFDITRDVAKELGVNILEADKIKININNLIKDKTNSNSEEKNNNQHKIFNIAEDICDARFNEILSYINDNLKNNDLTNDIKFNKIFIFGECSNYKNAKELTFKQFNCNAEVIDMNYIIQNKNFYEKINSDILKEENLQLLCGANFYINNIKLYQNAKRGFLFKIPSKISCFLKDLLY